MKVFLLVALLGLAAAQDCGDTSADLAAISSVQVNKLDQFSFKLSLTGHANAALSEGQLNLAMFLQGSQVYSQTNTFCNIEGITCPMTGDFKFDSAVHLPPLLMRGVYTAQLALAGASRSFCTTFKVQIGPDGAELVAPSGRLVDDSKEAVLNPTVIRSVNTQQRLWKAGHNEFFNGWTLKDIRGILATHIPGNEDVPAMVHDNADLPANFDSRTQWPGCVGPVMNQAKCGSCWAFGAAEAISDRMCIEGKSMSAITGNKYVQLSPLDLVSCDYGIFNHGCSGGMPYWAWRFAKTTGLVTEECMPYLTSEGGPIDPAATASTPSCTKKCANGADYNADKHKISTYYSVKGEQNMMAEIYKNGPIEGAFTVYGDFPAYTGGVYTQTSSQVLGGHAIKIVGWGEENGTKYWICQNSWTDTWGEKGFFRIRRGTNECGMENSSMAGTF